MRWFWALIVSCLVATLFLSRHWHREIDKQQWTRDDQLSLPQKGRDICLVIEKYCATHKDGRAAAICRKSVIENLLPNEQLMKVVVVIILIFGPVCRSERHGLDSRRFIPQCKSHCPSTSSVGEDLLVFAVFHFIQSMPPRDQPYIAFCSPIPPWLSQSVASSRVQKLTALFQTATEISGTGNSRRPSHSSIATQSTTCVVDAR